MSKHARKQVSLLKSRMPLSSSELDYVKLKGGYIGNILLKKYAHRITDAIKNTIRGNVINDPVAKQYIPQKEELRILPEENPDPIGDETHSPVKGIVHRYPDRVLYKITNICAVYCRYCFRKDMIGPGSGVLKPEEREAALDYIRQNKDIWEVILTGGDPFILSVRQIEEALDALCAIDHVQVIRIHTRVPIADPDRITKALCNSLKREKPVYVSVHINHVQEITEEVKRAIYDLHMAGCTLISQSVLLKGVNDNAQTLEDLFRTLVALKVKPYYLHHPDLAPGTGHFRVSIEEGQTIMKQLQGRVSGLCLPHYMLDIPGGGGKIPITPCYISELENGSYRLEDYQGNHHHYPLEGKS